MCGIAGFLDTSGTAEAELRDVVVRMGATLAHRGPDDAGAWVDAAAGVGLAARRLAIIDLSAEGHQPMVAADGGGVLAFNGEIYNHRALRRELDGAGHPGWRGHSDSEVLLATIRHHGFVDALRRLNGMFAIAYWDRAAAAVWLARDRLGEKPLYYAGAGGRLFTFGSELKSLAAHPAWRGELDPEAVERYLRLGYVPAPWSIYRGARKLRPGRWLRATTAGGRVTTEEGGFWSAREALGAGRPPPGEDAAVDGLEEHLRRSVRQRMYADVPVGAFLSGGVDSSTVVAMMQAEAGRPVRTFSVGFGIEGFDEAGAAAAVARHLGTDHTELTVGASDALEVIPRLPSMFDEPFADSSQIPTFLISALARRSVTVVLTGDGGDELFGGYLRYARARRLHRAAGWVPPRLRRLVARAITRPGPAAWDRVLRGGPSGDRLHKLAALLDFRGPEDLYWRLVAHRDGTGAPVEVERGELDYAAWMMLVDVLTYLPDDILVKVDRATMAASLEARVPLLDHELVEFVGGLPSGYKLRAGGTKWLLRQVAARHVPPRLTDRPKMGFGAPVAVWLRGPLREWAGDLLAVAAGNPVFEGSGIDRMWREHLSGHRDWNRPLWDVLVFQAWQAA